MLSKTDLVQLFDEALESEGLRTASDYLAQMGPNLRTQFRPLLQQEQARLANEGQKLIASGVFSD